MTGRLISQYNLDAIPQPSTRCFQVSDGTSHGTLWRGAPTPLACDSRWARGVRIPRGPGSASLLLGLGWRTGTAGQGAPISERPPRPPRRTAQPHILAKSQRLLQPQRSPWSQPHGKALPTEAAGSQHDTGAAGRAGRRHGSGQAGIKQPTHVFHSRRHPWDSEGSGRLGARRDPGGAGEEVPRHLEEQTQPRARAEQGGPFSVLGPGHGHHGTVTRLEKVSVRSTGGRGDKCLSAGRLLGRGDRPPGPA